MNKILKSSLAVTPICSGGSAAAFARSVRSLDPDAELDGSVLSGSAKDLQCALKVELRSVEPSP